MIRTLACVTTLAATGALSVGVVAAQAAPTPTIGHVAGSVATSVAGSARRSGSGRPVPGGLTQNVQLWLKGDAAGAETYAAEVSDPRSGKYRRYLSPAAYTSRYAASTSAANDVRSWLSAHGFRDITVDPQRSYVRASATTATVSQAFSVHLKDFPGRDSHGKAVRFQSNDRDISLPAALAGQVLAVTGLNSAPAVTHLAAAGPAATGAAAEKDTCSAFYGQKTKTGLPKVFGVSSLPTHLCGYTGAQLRSAYGMNSANAGRGVTVALIEEGAPYKMLPTLARWATSNGLPPPVSTRYRELAIGRGGSCGNPFDIEEQLDVEASYAMAPAAQQLLVAGDSCDARLGGVQALFDADLAVLNGNGKAPLATIASNSWGADGENTPSSFISVQHAITLRAAAEGVGMYFSSGDAPGVLLPAADPYAIAVGGTSLGIDARGRRIFETGWSNGVLIVNGKKYDNFGVAGAAGGGPSLLWKQPTYQQGVVPAGVATPPGDRGSLTRVSPDISAVADLTTGMGMAITERRSKRDVYTTFPEGGTSLAAPLVAGMIADAQQGQPAAFGFANPALYTLAGTAAITDVLPVTAKSPTSQRGVYCADQACGGAPPSVWTFDDQDPGQTDQVTLPGYDSMSGIGSPNGQTFITALRRAGAA